MIEEALLQRIRVEVANRQPGEHGQVIFDDVDQHVVNRHVRYLWQSGELHAVDASSSDGEAYLVIRVEQPGFDAMRAYERKMAAERPIAKASAAARSIGQRVVDGGFGVAVGIAIAYLTFAAGLCPA